MIFQSLIRQQLNSNVIDVELIILSIQVLLLLIYSITLIPSRQLLIKGTSDYVTPDIYLSTSICPYTDAQCMSRTFFCWVNTLMNNGHRGLIESVDDLFDLPKHLKIAELNQYINSYCSSDSNHYNKNCLNIYSVESSYPSSFEVNAGIIKKKIKIFKLLNSFIVREFFILALPKIASDICAFLGPISLNLILNFMDNKNSEPLWHGILYTVMLISSSFFGSLLSSHYTYDANLLALKVKSTVISVIYNKLLIVSNSALNSASNEVINLVSIDADRVGNFVQSFHPLWSLPVQVGVVLFLLYQQVGLAFLAGLCFTIILIPINKWLMVRISSLTKDMMFYKDKRIKLITQILHGIRVIKLCAWTDYFLSRVQNVRKQEMKFLSTRKYLDAMCVFFWVTTPVFISILTFVIYVESGHYLTAAKIFTSIALFGLLITPLNAFPWVVNGIVEAYISLIRVQNFLDIDDISPCSYYLIEESVNTSHLNDLHLKNCDFKLQNDVIKRSTNVVKDDINLIMDHQVNENDLDDVALLQPDIQDNAEIFKDTTFSLTNISLNIPQGSFIGIVGDVGSGKTSLLLAILGEITKTKGSLYIGHSYNNGFGYHSQEPWIMQTSIQKNILLGQEFVKDRYNNVILACALNHDLKLFPLGDQTLVGESGATLSGGQKARISLARAMYRDVNIYLFDDPLSAVDTKVGDHIVEQGLLQLLNLKTRILVTHNINYLKKADYIVFMELGKISKIVNPNNFSSLTTFANASALINETMHDSNTGNNFDISDNSRINESEELEWMDKGEIKIKIYSMFWKMIGSGMAISILVSLFLMQASKNISDWWLSYWVNNLDRLHKNGSYLQIPNLEEKNYVHDRPREALLSNELYRHSISLIPNYNWSLQSNINNSTNDISFYLTIYGSMVCFNALATAARSFLFAYGCLKAAKNMHVSLYRAIAGTSMRFFNIVPIGQILNRISLDIFTIDDSLPFILNIFFAQSFALLGSIVICCYGLPEIIVLVLLLAVIYYFIQRYYRLTSRELKRVSCVAASPLFNHFNETINGLMTIRASRSLLSFKQDNSNYLEATQKTQFANYATQQWLNIRLQMIGVSMIMGISVFALLEQSYMFVNPGLVGLAITYALSITNLLNGLIGSFTETEKMMVSVERCHHYINTLEIEDFLGNFQLLTNWPSYGEIIFENVILRYAVNSPPALNQISFHIYAGESVGIVGRTGAGKSSILSALFRLHSIEEGLIKIDGMDVSGIPLNEYRRSLSIIPQEPFIFDGTIRENIDPLNSKSDIQIIEVLKKCYLIEIVENNGGLDGILSPHILSLGEKQLFCLARVLLSDSKIVCIDEATANIDPTTEERLQNVISNHIIGKTVLIIAHRVSTILRCDRIFVMSNGKVVEEGNPKKLSEDQNSLFYELSASKN